MHEEIPEVKLIRALAVGVVMLATASLSVAAGDKVEVPVTDGGVVKVRPTCLGEDAVLEVEVEVKGMAADARCAVYVESAAGSRALPAFTTDDEGEGETWGHVGVSPEIDVPLTVTITIECEGESPIVVEVEVTFDKPCQDD